MSAGPARRPLAWAVRAMSGKGVGAVEGAFAGAASDSREVTPGRLFFALPGERVDGFDFCAAAAKAGAAALVVAAGRGRPAGSDGVPVIEVADPRRALGDLAKAARAEFRGRVVGVTGSNGKTTTKELIAAALSPFGAVLKTKGSLNTDVGLPRTVLEATGDEAFWVLEMAMRARGEIAYLADLARPHVGLVTNVAPAHLGRLGSLDEVARAKGEIWGGLAEGGIGILPSDEPRLEREAALLPDARKRRFGPAGDVRLLEVVGAGVAGSVVRLAVGEQPVVVRLPLPGEHNARNAAAALAVVMALGLPVLPAAAALARTELPPHRSRLLTVGGRTILDDCYNANPASMSAALSTMLGQVGAGRAFAVLGDMLELGPEAESIHEELGRQAARQGLTGLAALGPLGARIVLGASQAGVPQSLTTDDPDAAAAAVAGWSAPGDWILVKASRGLRLERAVAALERTLAKGG